MRISLLHKEWFRWVLGIGAIAVLVSYQATVRAPEITPPPSTPRGSVEIPLSVPITLPLIDPAEYPLSLPISISITPDTQSMLEPLKCLNPAHAPEGAQWQESDGTEGYTIRHPATWISSYSDELSVTPGRRGMVVSSVVADSSDTNEGNPYPSAAGTLLISSYGQDFDSSTEALLDYVASQPRTHPLAGELHNGKIIGKEVVYADGPVYLEYFMAFDETVLSVIVARSISYASDYTVCQLLSTLKPAGKLAAVGNARLSDTVGPYVSVDFWDGESKIVILDLESKHEYEVPKPQLNPHPDKVQMGSHQQWVDRETLSFDVYAGSDGLSTICTYRIRTYLLNCLGDQFGYWWSNLFEFQWSPNANILAVMGFATDTLYVELVDENQHRRTLDILSVPRDVERDSGPISQESFELTFSADGSRLLVGNTYMTNAETIYLYDLNGAQLATVGGTFPDMATFPVLLDNNSFLFVRAEEGALYRKDVWNLSPKRLADFSGYEPRLSPNRRRFTFYTISQEPEQAVLWTHEISSGQQAEIASGVWMPQWLDDGHLVGLIYDTSDPTVGWGFRSNGLAEVDAVTGETHRIMGVKEDLYSFALSR